MSDSEVVCTAAQNPMHWRLTVRTGAVMRSTQCLQGCLTVKVWLAALNNQKPLPYGGGFWLFRLSLSRLLVFDSLAHGCDPLAAALPSSGLPPVG